MFPPACRSGLTTWVHEKLSRSWAGTLTDKAKEKTVIALNTTIKKKKGKAELKHLEKTGVTGMPATGVGHEKLRKSASRLRWIQRKLPGQRHRGIAHLW